MAFKRGEVKETREGGGKRGGLMDNMKARTKGTSTGKGAPKKKKSSHGEAQRPNLRGKAKLLEKMSRDTKGKKSDRNGT